MARHDEDQDGEKDSRPRARLYGPGRRRVEVSFVRRGGKLNLRRQAGLKLWELGKSGE